MSGISNSVIRESASQIFTGYEREYGNCRHKDLDIPPAQRLITDLAKADRRDLPNTLHLLGHDVDMRPEEADDALRVVHDISKDLPKGSETPLAVGVYASGRQQTKGADDNLLFQLWNDGLEGPQLLAAITAAFRDSEREHQAKEILSEMIKWVNRTVPVGERGEYRRAAFVAAPTIGNPLLLEWYLEGIGQPGEEGWLAVKNAKAVAEARSRTGLSAAAKECLENYTSRYADQLCALVLAGTDKIYNPSKRTESIDLRQMIGHMAPKLAEGLPPRSGFFGNIVKLLTRL